MSNTMDFGGVIKDVHDEDNHALRVTVDNAVTLSAGTNVTLTQTGNNITINSTGGGGGGANQALSNLTSPTAINQDLLPGVDASDNLGSGSKRWAAIYALTAKDSSTFTSIDINQRRLIDSTSNISLAYNSRQLLANDGTTEMMDWSSAGVLDAKTNQISNVVDPVNPQDAATKNYVDTNLGSGANTSLSNLTTTSINTDLLPGSSDTYNIGSTFSEFNNIFSKNMKLTNALSTSTINDVSVINDNGSGLALNSSTSILIEAPEMDLMTGAIINVADPVNPQDAATKAYVDAHASMNLVSEFTLSPTDITNKFVTLAIAPTTPSLVLLTVIGGGMQAYTTDFTISGTQFGWSGLGLDGILSSGDILIVQSN